MFDMFRRPRLCLSLLRRPQNPIVGWSFSSSVGLTLSSSMFFSQSVLAITMKGHNVVVIQRAVREREIPDLVVLHGERKKEGSIQYREIKLVKALWLYASHEMRDSYVWVKLALIQVEDSKKTWDRRRHLVVCIS
ncbi:hypothetical protein Bca101_039851 [Brassica carinata]